MLASPRKRRAWSFVVSHSVCQSPIGKLQLLHVPGGILLSIIIDLSFTILQGRSLFQGNQNLADAINLRVFARKSKLVHQRDLVVLAPLRDSRITLCAAYDVAARQRENSR
jgi:hypothetical protein